MTESDPAQASKLRRRFRPIGFVMGLCVGFLLTVIVNVFYQDFKPNVRITLSGADITNSGGVKIVLRDRYNTWSQTCRGGCDDVRLMAQMAGDSHRLKITNAAHDCLFCESIYVMGREKNDWQVGGRPKLSGRYVYNHYPLHGDQTWPVEPDDR